MLGIQTGWNALRSASNSGDLEVVRLLLDRGADMEATNKVALPTNRLFLFVFLFYFHVAALS
jgi:ankyrin repeat protein